MRHTFGSHSQVAHVWAQQNLDYGSGKNVSFRGPTFYSYSTPVANFVTDKDGTRVALVYRGNYSTSTGKHLSHVRNAVSGSVYYVEHVGAEGDMSPRAHGENFHKLNAEAMIAEYQGELAKQMRGYGDAHMVGSLARIARKIAAYVERFEVEGVELPQVDADAEAVAARIAARSTPEAVAKREKAAKAREARQALLAQDTESKWLRGERVTLHRTREEGALLRLIEQGAVIETSQGARFPVEHGKRAFPLIARVREAQQPYRRNGHTIHLGMFAIDEIDAEGNVTAGCHFVRFDEIERMARMLGLLPPEPAQSEAA